MTCAPMAHTTRRGTQSSPFELDPIDPGPPITAIDTFQARISFEPFLRTSIIASDLRAAALDADCADEDADWEDDVALYSRAPTPLSRSPSPQSEAPASPTPLFQSPSRLTEPPASPSPSRSAAPPSPTRSSSPLSDTDLDLNPDMPALYTPLEALICLPQHKRRPALGKKERRRCKRVSMAKAAAFGPEPQDKHSRPHTEHLNGIHRRRTSCGLGRQLGGRSASQEGAHVAKAASAPTPVNCGGL
ncbi:hypothetical protein DFH09DRAFT_1124528 [Mycena vulgaris]|nr:hypothetical protein DFH09DRAFT_1124528 [Mycena vulgaris]